MAMTRNQAKRIIFQIIESEIISEELKQELNDVANAICTDSFDECEYTSPYCAGCPYLTKEYGYNEDDWADKPEHR